MTPITHPAEAIPLDAGALEKAAKFLPMDLSIGSEPNIKMARAAITAYLDELLKSGRATYHKGLEGYSVTHITIRLDGEP